MKRILDVARLHTEAWIPQLFWPWGIMALSLAVNILIFASIDEASPGKTSTGGLSSLYVTAAIVAAVSISQVFPFALGMGVTRRTFYLATSLVIVVQAAVYGVLLYLLNLIEGGTNGFGIGLHFFRIPYIDVSNGLLQIAVYAVPFLFLNFLCVFTAVWYVRFGTNGLFATGAAVILVFGLLAALVTWQGWWGDVWHWLSTQHQASLLVGWPALVAALAALGGMAAIRRANA
ncbi:ABC transporter permease [Asanoa sp. WMMD1127]|uniref:ABC transporter permease n=1 Tax=Asanoa sp. WMMD1127 TaxID=3016107 RepID=UPI002417009F|nr:ABC transporter permease [Asanoa sp. WMMD1127]MDG4826783.1 ABC transporter permease [Asanoa sp. WMMD1127]